MKKYFVSCIFGLLVGVFLGKMVLKEYNGYSTIRVSSTNGESAYFIKYGEYASLDDVEKKTIVLTNYIYTYRDNKYVVYIGITLDKNNLDKMINYFKRVGYNVDFEEYVISDEKYIDYLRNADKLIENTTDDTVMGEVCSQILSKYEELVINGSKN